MLSPAEILNCYHALPTDEKQWTMKIGEPVQVRYSDSILELWEILLMISEIGEGFCNYVEIMGKAGYYSRSFDGQEFFQFCTDAPIRAAIETEKNVLKSKARLKMVDEEVWEIELF